MSFDQILEKYTSLGELPLAIGIIVTKNDGLVYSNGFGLRDVTDKSSVVTKDTVVAFYSTTKAITTTALVQLIESGKIDSLDDPVEKYVPEIKDIKLLTGFEADGTPILVEAKNKPTLRHLVTHTAGFSYTFFSHKYLDYSKATGKGNILNSKWDEFTTPFINEPGTKWHYGVNIDWVGKVVESVSGQTLDAYCKEHIFKPLGASSLTFVRGADQYANQAEIHARIGEKEFKPLKGIHPEIPEFHAGGHGVWGRLEDYLKFLEIFLHEGKSPSTGAQILKPQSIENYSFKNLLPEGVKVTSSLEESQPEFSKFVSFDPYGDKQSWTASFHKTDIDLPTGRSAGSYNWAGLPNLYYWIDPVKGIAGMFATQVFPFFDPAALKAFGEFETAAYEKYA